MSGPRSLVSCPRLLLVCPLLLLAAGPALAAGDVTPVSYHREVSLYHNGPVGEATSTDGGPFNESFAQGGGAASQSSWIGPTVVTGQFHAGAPGSGWSGLSRSIYTFELNEPTEYDIHGTHDAGAFGDSAAWAQARLYGPGDVLVFNFWVNAYNYESKSFSQSGLLDPGTYRLDLNIHAVGSEYGGAYADMDVMFIVPEPGALGLFVIGAGILRGRRHGV